MLKNVFSRLAREIERRHPGKRRSHAPAPVPMQIEQLEPRQLMTNQVMGIFRTGHTMTLTSTTTSSQSDSLSADGETLQILLNASANNQAILSAVANGPAPIPHNADLRLVFTDPTNNLVDTNSFSTSTNTASFSVSIPNLPANTTSTFRVDVMRSTTLTLPVLRVMDDASTQLMVAITNDTTFPTTSITSTASNPTNGSTIPVTVTFSESVTGFVSSDVVIGNGTISNFGGSGSTYTFNVTPMGDGAVTVDVPGNRADDAAGNGNLAATQFSRVVDTTPPAATDAPTLDASDDTGRSPTDGVTFLTTNLTFNGTATGATSVIVNLTRNGTTISQPATFTNSNSYTATFAGSLVDGTYVVSAAVSDGLNSVSTINNRELKVDTVAAQLMSFDLTTASDSKGSHILSDDNLTNDSTPTFTFSGAEPDAAVSLLRGAVSNMTETPASGETATSVTATTTAAGVHQFAVFQTDLAGNVSATSANLAVAVDTTLPTVASLKLPAAITLPSSLRVSITTSTSPTVDFKLTDQFFSGFTNTTEVKLFERLPGGTLKSLTTSTTIISNNSAKDLSLTPDDPLSFGQHSVFVRATDAAGNVSDSTPDFNFFISQPGADTVGAPGTPVFSETYFLGSTLRTAVSSGANTLLVDRPIPVGQTLRGTSTTGATFTAVVQSVAPSGSDFLLTLTANLSVNVSQNALLTWLRPWNMSFDRTTQTIWFTNEDGHRLGQFDPATGGVTLFDISLSGDNTATDPHGVIFDLDTHVTPRVWLVFRNTSDADPDTPTPPANEPGRVTYLDLDKNELLTFNFTGLLKPDGTSRLVEQLHATFIDARGHLWISSEDSGELIELDFDQQLDGTLNPSINSRTGRIIAHELPEGLGDVIGGTAFEVEPHGMALIVDDRTGEQYIYFSDGDNASSGRAYLLKPGRPANSIPVGQPGHDPGTPDRWIDFNVDEALISEVRLETDAMGNTSASGHSLFMVIDDNETPGIPEDDHLLISDPGNSGTAGGVIRRFAVRGVIEALQDNPNQPALPPTVPTQTVRIPKIPGADSTQTFSRPQLPFSDREGTTFFVDAQGSVGRFHFNDPGVNVSTINAPVLSFTTTPVAFAIPLTARAAPMTTLTITAQEVGASGRDDRSQADGIDQYEVARTSSRNRTDGAFRGTINAANVLYGSLAQSDFVSTTVFAETPRRQMSVVADPTAMPMGAIVEGRMAFQVARNGSLIMTSRGNGMLLDQQRNLSRDLIVAGSLPANSVAQRQILIDGDSSAVTQTNGNVHVFGKNQVGGLVEYRFVRATNLWTSNVLPIPATGILAGEPTAFIDEQGRVGALINRDDGHLLLYRNDGTAPIDLTNLVTGGGPNVFTSVDIVEDTVNNRIFVYGSNQGEGSNQARSVVEYSFSTMPSTLTAADVTGRTVQVTTGQIGRETQIFQSVSAVLAGGTRHIFGTDGHSRLVHLAITNPTALLQSDPITAFAENVTELTKATATGYFDTFQQGTKQVNGETLSQEFAARVYPELSVLVDPANGNFFVYGTNGLDLVEFTRTGSNWSAANLTNDILKGTGTSRIPANKVFGAPGAYVTPGGDRHVFQINADGDVVEYAFRKTRSGGHFNTQNINLARGNTYSSLSDISATVAPRLNIPASLLDTVVGGPTVLVYPNSTVTDSDSANFNTGELIVRTINGATGDVVGIRPQTVAGGGVISVAANAVSFNTVPFGLFTGGTGSTPLVITLNAASTQAALEALLRSLQFSTPAASPIGVRFVEVVLTDNTGRPSNRVAQQITVDDAIVATNPLINPLL